MSLKAKIIVKLKAKATALGVNLSNVRINGLADKLDGIITNEDDIDVTIDNLDQVLSFKELAALDDAKRNAESKTAEEEAAKAEKARKEAEEKAAAEAGKGGGGSGDEMPAWFKQHAESQNKIIETLTATVTSLQNGNTAQTRRQQLEAKLKDAPERFKTQTLRNFDRLKLDSEEDFTGYLAEVEQDVADEIQAESDAGLGNDFPGKGAAGGSIKEASQGEIDALFGEIKI